MGKSVVARGKSVKQAVAIALDLLKTDKEEVDIEVLETETKGILGIGAKPAVVRVSSKKYEYIVNETKTSFLVSGAIEEVAASLNIPVEAAISANSEIKATSLFEMDELGGKVWVIDGQILCKDAPDKYPLISPVKRMKCYKNDVLIEKTVIIREDDTLEVKLEDEVQEPVWELIVSDNRMEAILKVIPGFRVHRRLKDKSPSNYVQLEVEERKLPLIIETGPIMDELKDMGITLGVNYTEIAMACTSEEAGQFVIARGTPPVPGKHGYFHPVQQVEITKGLKERSDGTIDYREIQQFPSVDRGQVIGVVIPPVRGIPGTTVTNELVFPPEVCPLIVHAGKGVELVEEGNKVIATDAGHPEIKVKGQLAQISVIPKLRIGRDVNLQTGNVRYIGDVEILGSVQDGMTVEAQGNLLISHNVNMAHISSGGSMIVQNNIITSEVTAGKGNLLKAEISQILGELLEQLKQMALAINQLSAVSAFKVSSFTRTGLGPLIKILCDGKFKSFIPLAAALIKKVKSGPGVLGEEWIGFSERIQDGFITVHSSNLRSGEDIRSLMQAAEGLFASTQTADEEKCFIRAGFVHNSQLYCSGDIVVVGQGMYNSKFHAGGSVEVDGFVRGGEIYAAQGAKIQEAGTKGGIVTKITVPGSASIKIHLALEDTVIQVGAKTHKFTVQATHVYARLNESGELILF